ncbi:hypothetical protein MNBD_GAMMA15-1969 [hydrothermal vent metagenome]|uniref:Uncharacterized protein n=1 Tax=hydrothermal vent metagenome TaxID=652676 RepID=A0A3B0Z3A0_9ZZZZ
MSGAQLARRLGVSRVVYAVVPESSAGDLVAERARKKAEQLIRKTNVHMALEQQGLDEKQLSFELERLQRELIQEMPSDLWNDD